MSQNTIKDLLDKLKSEIETTEVDSESRKILFRLESDIQIWLNETSEKRMSTTMMETAEMLETEFASEHPTAERLVREIIDALARMGI
ncbi:MAG: putative transcriptional regulator [Candidatus Azotimanducaceae bacterium]|jgi:predicted transcriptional regulator